MSLKKTSFPPPRREEIVARAFPRESGDALSWRTCLCVDCGRGRVTLGQLAADIGWTRRISKYLAAEIAFRWEGDFARVFRSDGDSLLNESLHDALFISSKWFYTWSKRNTLLFISSKWFYTWSKRNALLFIESKWLYTWSKGNAHCTLGSLIMQYPVTYWTNVVTIHNYQNKSMICKKAKAKRVHCGFASTCL